MEQIEIVTSLLFRVEEACCHTAGRIRFLGGDEVKAKELQEQGYIESYHPLVNNTHDSCTHVVWLTLAGWQEASKLRRELADKAKWYYLQVLSDAKEFGEEVASIRLNQPYGNLYKGKSGDDREE